MAFQGEGLYKISKGFKGEKRYLTTKDFRSPVMTDGPFEKGISWSIHPLEGAEEGVYQIGVNSLGNLPVVGYLVPVFDTDKPQPNSGTLEITSGSDVGASFGWRIVEAKGGFSVSVALTPSSNVTLPNTLYLVEEDGVISLKTQDSEPVRWNFQASNTLFQGEGTYKISKGFRGEKFYLTTQNDGSLVRTGGPFEEGISWSIDPLVGAEYGVYQITAHKLGCSDVIGFLEPVFAADGIQPDSGAMRVNPDSDAPKVGWIIEEAEVGYSVWAASLPFDDVSLDAPLYLVEEAGTILWKTKGVEPGHWNFEAIDINQMTFRGAGTYRISKGSRGEKFYLTTREDGSLARSPFDVREGPIVNWFVERLEGVENGPYYITASALGKAKIMGTLEPVYADDDKDRQCDSGSVRAIPGSRETAWSIFKAEAGFSVRYSPITISVNPQPTIYLVEHDGNIGWKTKDEESVHWNFEPVSPFPFREELKAEDV